MCPTDENALMTKGKRKKERRKVVRQAMGRPLAVVVGVVMVVMVVMVMVVEN